MRPIKVEKTVIIDNVVKTPQSLGSKLGAHNLRFQHVKINFWLALFSGREHVLDTGFTHYTS